jgi:predicted nucleotidyltransferase
MPAVPEPHASFLRTAVARLAEDRRLVGLAAGGSYLSGRMDEFSDLDLVVAVEPEAQAAVLEDRRTIAGRLGEVLAAFTGEHVGEPRLLICLYGPPLLHVDLKFVSLADVGERVEDPAVLWEREGRLSAALRSGRARYPEPDLQWIEDRFWVWVHYGAAKIGRGELFEALDFLGSLRMQVLGPLSLRLRGARPCGVRRLESAVPDLASAMEATLATHDARSCANALRAAAESYRWLRDAEDRGSLARRDAAERAAMAYLGEIVGRLPPSPSAPSGTR